MRAPPKLLAAAVLAVAAPEARAHLVSGPTPVAPFYMAGLALPRVFPVDGLRAGRREISAGGFSASVSRPEGQLPSDLVNMAGGGGEAGLSWALTDHAAAGALFALSGASGLSGAAFRPHSTCSTDEDCAPPDAQGYASGRGALTAAFALLDPTPASSPVRLPLVLGAAYVNGTQRTHAEGYMPPVTGGPSSFSTLTVEQRREGLGVLVGAAPQFLLGRWASVAPFALAAPAGFHESRSCRGSGNFDCADPGRVDEPLTFTGVSLSLLPARLSATYVAPWQAAGVWGVSVGLGLSF